MALGYSTKDNNADVVQEIEELVNEWQPEPLVAELTELELAEMEKRPVIVGYAWHFCSYSYTFLIVF
jgi:serine palmitoyltransferase